MTSFFLFAWQPGTAARINQSLNRLDVVFATSPKSPNAAIPPAAVAAPNAAANLAIPPPPTPQPPRNSRIASDVREGNGSINSDSSVRATNSAPSPGVLSSLTPSNSTASTSPSQTTDSKTAVSDKGLFAWSVRKSLLVLAGLLLLSGVALLFRRHNRNDTRSQSLEITIKPAVGNDGANEAPLANRTSPPAEPVGVALSLPDTSQSSPEIETYLAKEEASLLLQEQAVRRAAESLEAKQLAAEKARMEFEARSELQTDLEPWIQYSSLQVTSDPEVPSLEEENRYRREAETLRKAADELARMRQAAEAVRKAAEQEASRTAKEEKLNGMADLKAFAKKTVSNY